MEHETFIRVYENAVDLDYCDSLIKKFEDNPDQQHIRNTKDLRKIDDTTYERGAVLFDELHLWKYIDTWKEDIDTLAKVFTKYVDLYKSEFSPHCFPHKHGFEPFKMKRYKPNGKDEFGWHVDVRTFKNLKRFLAMFIYLSDNEEGKTEFEYQNTITDCKKGSMVIFPPMWPGLHRGTKPILKPKYFMGGYLHYVE